VPEFTLDDRFHDLRNEVDREILHARREVIAQLARAVARMRSAPSQAEWQEAVLDSGRIFANDPDALELLGSLAALTSPAVKAGSVKAAPYGHGSVGEVIAPAAMNGDGVAHAAALRFARVKVAEIQLYQTEAVKAGRASRDLYGTLKWHIDEAREAFREKFLTATDGTSDYLHAEMLHALANDDATLMGPGYPGPLA
jgi:hypothetical protein